MVDISTVSVTSPDGDKFVALKSGNGPWEISFPEGGDRFYGSEAEVRRHIAKLIKEGPSAKINTGNFRDNLMERFKASQ